MDYLYMDTSAILHAYRAGGIDLLDKYARLAKAKGLKLAITDVVWDEIFVGWHKRGPPPKVRLSPKRAALKKWLAANAIELATQERGLIEDLRAGRLAKYAWKDCGERSIAEHLLSKSEPHKSAVLSDDIKFRSNFPKLVESRIPKVIAEKILFTNPDLLVSACKERIIHIQQYEKFVHAFRTHCAPFNGNLPRSHSSAFDFCDEADVQRLREDKPVKGVRILGAFGRLMAATGIAFVAIDTMTTAARAASQIRDGDNEGATETVVEFGGRMAGAAIGAEEGILLGAALGSVVPGLGTTIGAIAGGAIGGIVGATVGEQAAKDVLEAVQGRSHPPMDERLTDSTMRDYREPEVQALQNDLYEAGYSSEEVNYVCASVTAARDAARPAEGESELHATLSVFAERIMSDVRSVTPDDNAAEQRDLPATQAVDRDVDADRLPDEDSAAASPGEVGRQPEAEAKGVDTVDAGKAAAVDDQAEAREIPHVVPAPGNEATSPAGHADGNSVEIIPPAPPMPDTDRGETPPNVPAGSSAVPVPKPDDRNDAREPVGPQAGQLPADANVSATPSNEVPATPREAPTAEPAQRSDVVEPGELAGPIPSNPVPSDPLPSDQAPGHAPEIPAASDLAPAPAPYSPPDQPAAATVPDVDVAPPTSPAPAAGEILADDQRPSPSGDAAGPNGGRVPHEMPDQSPPAERGAGQRSEDQLGSPGSPPAVTAGNVPADPVAVDANPVQPPPAGDEALADETLEDLDQLVDHEALAADADEEAMDEMSAGLVASDDQAPDATGLADLEPVLAHESLNNEGVESLVVTGVLLTSLDGSHHSSEPAVVPDDDEFLQDIEELVEDEAVEAKADEAAVDDMPDEFLSNPELTAGDIPDETAGGSWDEDRDTTGHGAYPGDDATGYGDHEDDAAGDTAGDDDRDSHSSDDDDE